MRRVPGVPLGAVLLLGCPTTADDEAGGASSGTSAGSTAATTSQGSTGAPPDGDTQADPDTTGTAAGTAADGTTQAADGSTGSSTGPGPGGYMFLENLPDEYVQIDRAGFPGFSTVFLLAEAKDVHNTETPAMDISSMDAIERVVDATVALHVGTFPQVPDNTGLDDDLAANGWAACSVTLGGYDCLDESRPILFPDVLSMVVGGPNAFPLGRPLERPIPDLMLGLALLDLQVLPDDKFVDLDEDGEPGPSLNPIANDVPFSPFWPYLAPAHR